MKGAESRAFVGRNRFMHQRRGATLLASETPKLEVLPKPPQKKAAATPKSGGAEG